MNSDVMITLERGHELRWVINNVATDHEMGCCLIFWSQKLHELYGRLVYRWVSDRSKKKIKMERTHWTGSVVKGASKDSIRRIPYIAGNSTLVRCWTNLRAVGVDSNWVDRICPGSIRRYRNIRNVASCHSGIQSVDPGRGECFWIRKGEPGEWETSWPSCKKINTLLTCLT